MISTHSFLGSLRLEHRLCWFVGGAQPSMRKVLQMAKEFAKTFYSSSRWKKCRDTFIQNRMLEDGGLCQECKEQLGYIVHHKEHLTPENINNPNVTLNESNLEWVCKECHDKLHNVFQREKRKYYFDKEGNFIVPP